jgi:hypothetical protein
MVDHKITTDFAVLFCALLPRVLAVQFAVKTLAQRCRTAVFFQGFWSGTQRNLASSGYLSNNQIQLGSST